MRKYVACICGFMLLSVTICIDGQAQTTSGAIKVIQVHGTVLKENTTTPNATVHQNDIVTERDTISTGENSSVILLLANCSTLQLSSDTRLEIAHFKMDPQSQDIVVTGSALQFSDTRLRLVRGEIIGSVRSGPAENRYSVGSIVGRVDIKSATFRISIVRAAAPDTMRQCLSVAEGSMLFVPFYPLSGQRPKNSPIDAGEELVAEASLDNRHPFPAKYDTFSKATVSTPALQSLREASNHMSALLATAFISVIEQQEAAAKTR